MVLVDTSVWVSHLRQANKRLQALLLEGKVLSHPFIIGELACGRLHKREEILRLMDALPTAVLAQHEEILCLIEEKHLMGRGLGCVDVHLIASALLTGVQIWTLDKVLKNVFDEMCPKK